MEKKDMYQNSGVSYQDMDPLKVLAQRLSRQTSRQLVNIGAKVIEESRGESAFVWQEDDGYRAFVVEGLGSKNLIADHMYQVTGKSYYDQIAKDTVAMIVNDLIVVGAQPQVINAYFAAGHSDWFKDKKRTEDLLHGWAASSELAGATWGGGETEVLQDIIMPNAIELSGSCVGKVKTAEPILGQSLQNGDHIVLVESNGIHANGLTLIRKLAQSLPNGYETRLNNQQFFGEEILRPTHIYASIVTTILDQGVVPHYMVNITGHGWRKIMRANQPFRYVLTETPDPMTLFTFLQERLGCSEAEMYATFNMGAGFALIVNPDESEKVVEIITKQDLKAWVAGHVEKGQKSVVIPGRGIEFNQDTLQVR
jgi:phosphoribosylformylglycinamidine cyclo-ligase